MSLPACPYRDNLGECHHVPTVRSTRDFAPPHRNAYTNSRLCKVLHNPAGTVDFCLGGKP